VLFRCSREIVEGKKAGVLRFLEETFSAHACWQDHRYDQIFNRWFRYQPTDFRLHCRSLLHPCVGSVSVIHITIGLRGSGHCGDSPPHSSARRRYITGAGSHIAHRSRLPVLGSRAENVLFPRKNCSKVRGTRFLVPAISGPKTAAEIEDACPKLSVKDVRRIDCPISAQVDRAKQHSRGNLRASGVRFRTTQICTILEHALGAHTLNAYPAAILDFPAFLSKSGLLLKNKNYVEPVEICPTSGTFVSTRCEAPL